MALGREREPEPANIFDDDDEGWEDMPVVRDKDEFAGGLDEEDQKRYHYQTPVKKDVGGPSAGNATGNLIDFDDEGAEWREKAQGGADEAEYTRLRMQEDDEGDEVHLRTKYLFNEEKAMTPLNQMQQTKNLLTEAQRIAYVGICSLVAREMSQSLKSVKSKELKAAIQNMELWALKIMGRIYYHMEVATAEQKMIESLAEHGVLADDLVPALMTTHTVANPEYDPAAARKKDEDNAVAAMDDSEDITSTSTGSTADAAPSTIPATPSTSQGFQTTIRVLEETKTAVPGVSTTLSNTDENVTLDIRWTVLCDLFLILVADSVYDARSRVLLEHVALKLGLGWLDVTRFERRVTDALEMQENIERLDQKDIVEGRQQSSKKRRYVMMGLATLGGGLVIGLSAGLLAPVIGAGIGTALATVGVTGTGAFLGGAGGAAIITTGGVLTGSGIAGRGMARRTQLVKTFELLPLHNNKRVNVIITVPGFMTGVNDDVRLPFSVIDPVVGDVFSVLWEPEMMGETGAALRILTGEVLTQIAQTALAATVMTALMSALQWPLILTKLGYLIDNPWNNALDRARAAGGVLADVLIQRGLGVRPVTLIGFSLGSRVIFYALLELAKQKAFGIVQDVFILGTTVTASQSTWHQARAAVSGRFVNGYAKNDWVLNYLFRATSGGLNTVAGLRAVENVPGLENVDVTDKIAGHMSYRTFMPLILDQLGFPVSAGYFDEPEEPDFTEDRIVVREGEELPKKKGWFGRAKKGPAPTQGSSKASRPPSGAARFSSYRKTSGPEASASTSATASATAIGSGSGSLGPVAGHDDDDDDDLPPRLQHTNAGRSGSNSPAPSTTSTLRPDTPRTDKGEEGGDLGNAPPAKAGFDFAAIKQIIGDDIRPDESPRGPLTLAQAPAYAQRLEAPERSESAPPPMRSEISSPSTPTAQPRPDFTRSASSAGAPPPMQMDDELSYGFTRSLALEDSNPNYPNYPDSMTSTSSTPTYPTYPTSYAAAAPSIPALSFAPADGPIWGAAQADMVDMDIAADITSAMPAGGTKPQWEVEDPWATPSQKSGVAGTSSSTGFGANPWG